MLTSKLAATIHTFICILLFSVYNIYMYKLVNVSYIFASIVHVWRSAGFKCIEETCFTRIQFASLITNKYYTFYW